MSAWASFDFSENVTLLSKQELFELKGTWFD